MILFETRKGERFLLSDGLEWEADEPLKSALDLVLPVDEVGPADGDPWRFLADQAVKRFGATIVDEVPLPEPPPDPQRVY